MRILKHQRHLLLGTTIFLLNAISTLSFNVLEVLVEGSVKLPCDVPLKKAGDTIDFIFWYKDEHVTPLYTLDARKSKNLENAEQTVAPNKKTKFFMHAHPPYLLFDNVIEEDTGLYYCRVDFQWASTKIKSLRLIVVVPPKYLVIRNSKGGEVREYAGPYREHQNVTLTCEAHGGTPLPNVTWYRGDKLIDHSFDKSSHFSSNQLVIPSVKRNDLWAPYICKAANSKLTQPISRSIQLDLILAPVSIRITNSHAPVSASRFVDMYCESKGSRPPAKLTWWLNRTSLLSDAVQTLTDDMTTSVLRLFPLPTYHRSQLMCRSENALLYPEGILEEVRILNVTFVPQVELRTTKEDKYQVPRQGEYLRMTCFVNANPVIYKVGWLYNDLPYPYDNSHKEMVSDNTLIFKRLARNHNGRYRCYAMNDEGKGVSEELTLNVAHAPICKEGQRITYSAFLFEPVTVRCQVDSNPPEVTFRWEFSNTVQKHYNLTFEEDGLISFATYIPEAEEDYGTLFCWANNTVGYQQSSCFFTVIAPESQPVNVRTRQQMLGEKIKPRGILNWCKLG